MFNKIYEKIKLFIKDNYKFFISVFLIIFIFNYEFPYIIYKSGGLINLEDRIDIDKEYVEKGSFNMSYVTAIKGTIPFLAISLVLPDWDILPIKEVTNDMSYEETLVIGKEYLNEGIDNAIISAFKLSKYNINIDKYINTVLFISDKADTDILVGDEIISINDKEVKDLISLREYINTLKENDRVKLLVNNNGKEYERYAVLYKDSDDLLKVGVSFKTTYKYTTEIPVSIKMKDNESGSSGGLMMALSIYNALTDEDITHGKKIAGTGSITSEGVVEEIGGVKYKVLGAYKNKADVFLCPEENYKEAMNIKKKRNLDIEIIKVHTLEDAVNYLENLN